MHCNGASIHWSVQQLTWQCGVVPQAVAQATRRSQIYVHAKTMMVDDEVSIRVPTTISIQYCGFNNYAQMIVSRHICALHVMLPLSHKYANSQVRNCRVPVPSNYILTY